AAVGPGSYNFLDSLYLLSTLSGDTVGVSGGALITDARQIDNYVRWGLGAQYHPTARSTLAADYSRFTSERLVDGVMWAPDYRTLRVGGEYQLSERVAVRAGYARLSQDEDRNKLIDKREGHEITLGLGYTRDGRKSMELVYLTGNFTSDFADPSHLEVQERGLHLYGRLSF
ncbi:MAG TPA: hypothetical protein VMS93_00800, partial [Candidatus Saccharimonadales bacterium]|nr:hypothetical protein [Candidatus Saccharimonadales bacterium]